MRDDTWVFPLVKVETRREIGHLLKQKTGRTLGALLELKARCGLDLSWSWEVGVVLASFRSWRLDVGLVPF